MFPKAQLADGSPAQRCQSRHLPAAARTLQVSCWTGSVHTAPPFVHQSVQVGRCEDRSQSSKRMLWACGGGQTRLWWAGTCAHVSWGGRAWAPPWTQPCLGAHWQWTVGVGESRPREHRTQDLSCRPVSISPECLHGAPWAHRPHLAFQAAPQPSLRGPRQLACGPHQGRDCTWGSPLLGRMLSCHHHFEIPKN